MYYVLLDSTGNLIESYREEDAAQAALARIIEDEPDAVDDVVLIAYDEAGDRVEDPVFVARTEDRTRPSHASAVGDAEEFPVPVLS